ncbi:methyl-accepting chemotaxis protein [Pseudobutyrivibrio sp.]|uniref:methyl-accepting chemotaxis protein n=1 Tax=Pseudobutyrivibrio sp. TaxID=2014367 RepID=UPI0025F8875D|nr:methyl-accepting chemotaxis protein [Pseudobutyrivibrio sp.]MBR5648817.1 methyl-accepting chemotaxis protein [Pseudobutyrivibrio sp.]
MRFKKLSLRITVFIVIATTIGILAQSFVTSISMLNIMENEAEIELKGIVEQTTARLSAYIEKEYAYLDGYMISPDMAKLIESPEDEEARADAINYTKYYATVVPNMKSMFYVEYDGKVLVHTKPEMIGFQNDPERIKMIQGLYYNPEGTTVYNSVAAVSPATNDISLVFARSSYKSNGQPAGYSSVEIDKTEFYDLLVSAIHVTNNQDVVLTGVRNPVVYYSSNADEITLKTENPAVLSVMEKLEGVSSEEEGMLEYSQAGTKTPMYGYYKYLPERDWLLFVGADTTELYGHARNASRQIYIFGLIVVAVIAVILAFIIGYLIKPITKIQKALTRVADLDLTDNAEIEKFENRADEIGKLAVDTKSVIYNLKGAVGVFKEYSHVLDENSGNLNEASKVLSDITAENQSIANNLSVKINETNDAIELIHAEIENIVSQVEIVSEKVETGQSDSAELIKSATDINAQINQEIDNNMATLQQTMATMQEALESLKAVEQINVLAEDIMSITSQTNLLSLNASIEAARAGEAGRGFAVVADEIGQLAEQSKNTAMDITEIVAASNASVTNVREQVEKLIDFIRNDIIASYEAFSQQGQHYDEGVSTIKQAVADIGDAMNSLSNSVDEIARQIASVTDASINNTDGVSNILGKNEETNEVSENIEKLAEDTKGNAKDLRVAINQFNID